MFNKHKPRELEILGNVEAKLAEINTALSTIISDGSKALSPEQMANLEKQREFIRKEVERAKQIIIPDAPDDKPAPAFDRMVSDLSVDTPELFVPYGGYGSSASPTYGSSTAESVSSVYASDTSTSAVYATYEGSQKISEEVKTDLANFTTDLDDKLDRIKMAIANEVESIKAANIGETYVEDKLKSQSILIAMADQLSQQAKVFQENSGTDIQAGKLWFKNELDKIQITAQAHRDGINKKYSLQRRHGIIVDELKTKMNHLQNEVAKASRIIDKESISEINKLIEQAPKKRDEFVSLVETLKGTDFLSFNSDAFTKQMHDVRADAVNLISTVSDTVQNALLQSKLKAVDKIEDTEFKQLATEFLKKTKLVDQIDSAFKIHFYQSPHSHALSDEEKQQKKVAVSLLKTVLHTDNDKELQILMQQREEMKKINPDYLPKTNIMQLTLPGAKKTENSIVKPDLSATEAKSKWQKVAARAVAQSQGTTLSISEHGLIADAGYSLRQLPDTSKLENGNLTGAGNLEQNVLYVQRAKNGFDYVVVDPAGQIKNGTITSDLLKINDVKGMPLDEVLRPKILDILKITSTIGHTAKAVTVEYTPEQLEQHRILFDSGKFYKRDQTDGIPKPWDTSHNLSHSKEGFSAYVINVEGDMYGFDHHRSLDNVAHSSFAGGKETLCAGEIKTVDGVLKSITGSSGHFLPAEFHIYSMLKNYQKQGGNLEGVNVLLIQPLDSAKYGELKVEQGNGFYSYDAKQFCQKIEGALSTQKFALPMAIEGLKVKLDDLKKACDQAPDKELILADIRKLEIKVGTISPKSFSVADDIARVRLMSTVMNSLLELDKNIHQIKNPSQESAHRVVVKP